jgi:hypothetical protein
MTWAAFWQAMRRALKFGAGKAVDGLEEALEFLAPYAVRFILDVAASKLSGAAKRERVLERLRDRAARVGINLPESVLSLSLEGEYNRLKAEGKIPGKDYAALLAAIPKLEELVAGVKK